MFSIAFLLSFFHKEMREILKENRISCIKYENLYGYILALCKSKKY